MPASPDHFSPIGVDHTEPSGHGGLSRKKLLEVKTPMILDQSTMNTEILNREERRLELQVSAFNRKVSLQRRTLL